MSDCRALRLLVWLVLAALVPAGLWAAPAEPDPNRRIVVFQPNVSTSLREAIVRQEGGEVVRRLDLIHAVVATTSKDRVQGMESGLKGRPEVVRVDPDPYVKWIEEASPRPAEFVLPSIGSLLRDFKAQREGAPVLPGVVPALEEPEEKKEMPWGVERVNAQGAWGVTQGAGVKVCVIDTGVDPEHSDLKANVAGGYNTTFDGKWPDKFMDDHGHGTHVSGTIGALWNNQGVVGVAPKATLYGVKVLDKNGSGYFSWVIAGIEWCAKNKTNISNMSLGASSAPESFHDAIKAADAAGLAQVAAAGNSGGEVGVPANYPEVMAISASDSSDDIAWFSSRGPEIAFIAPGVGVRSTYRGGGYTSMSGTSMACPHVVGLGALAISRGASTTAGVRSALKAAAVPLKGLKPDEQGAGLINAAKLVGN